MLLRNVIVKIVYRTVSLLLLMLFYVIENHSLPTRANLRIRIPNSGKNRLAYQHLISTGTVPVR
jgi:hypothetical protein